MLHLQCKNTSTHLALTQLPRLSVC